MTSRALILNGILPWVAVVVAAGQPVPPESEVPDFTVTEAEIKLPGVTLDRKTLEVRIDAEVCLTSGILEYVVCRPGTFEHESIFTTEATPELVHAALLLAGLKPTPQKRGMAELWWERALKRPESRVEIEVEWEQEGVAQRERLTSMMKNREVADPRGGKPEEKKADVQQAWVFAGSFMQEDQRAGRKVYAANISGIMVGIWPDPSTVIQYGVVSGNPYEGKDLGMEINEERVPPLGTKVKLVFSRLEPAKEGAPLGE